MKAIVAIVRDFNRQRKPVFALIAFAMFCLTVVAVCWLQGTAIRAIAEQAASKNVQD